MKPILQTLVDEPSAWTAQELRRDPTWVSRFSSDEIEELEHLASVLRDRGLPYAQVTREDINAPLLRNRAKGITHQLEQGRGCVLIQGLEVARYDRETIDLIYWLIGIHLGQVTHHNPAGDLIGEVRDKGIDYRDPMVRGYTTNQALGYHCDGTDAVSLLCLQTAKSGGESRICSSMALFNRILEEHPEYLPPLFEGFYFNLRGEGQPGEVHPVTRHKVPVFSYVEGRLSARFLQKAIVEGQKFVGEPVTGLAAEALEYMQSLAASDDFRYDMDFQLGDIQILNNYVTLHSRGAFEDWPDETRKRTLLRMWMYLENGRTLDPEFADRYNMGPRKTMRLAQVNPA